MQGMANYSMRFLMILLIGALTFLSVSAKQLNTLPAKVIVDGSLVPQSVLLLNENAIVISCEWLNNNAPSLTCNHDPLNEFTNITENAIPLEGRDASGCCASWQRYMTFRTGKVELGRYASSYGTTDFPLFGIGVIETEGSGMSVPKSTVEQNIKIILKNKDAFVPLQVVAQYMKMPFQTSTNSLNVGTTAGFKQTLELVETGETWQARAASRYLRLEPPKRFLSENPKPITEKDSVALKNTLLLWQRGQVKQLLMIRGVFLEYWQLRDKTWTIPYQAQLKNIPTWLCSPNSSKRQSVWQAIGTVILEIGQRPKFTGDFSKHASCGIKTKEYLHTQFFSSLQSNGLDVPKMWLATTIYDPQFKSFITRIGDPEVIDLKTGLLTKNAVPKDYGFMQE
jgi:hypothetical protein